MDWTEILVVAIPATLGLIGLMVTQRGKRDEKRDEREERLETRMDRLEKEVDNLREDLRAEQRFSHKVVLMLTRVLYYLRDATAYRLRYQGQLPGEPPPLPDPDEIEQLLAERPTYSARADP